MKNFTLFLFILFTIQQNGFSQNEDYVPMFGEKSAGWFQYADLQEISGITTLKTYFEGDTVAHNNTYIGLMTDWHILDDDSVYTSFTGYYREDIEERKVYSLNGPTDPNPEKLVYDFSISPGDTVQVSVNVILLLDSINHTISFCDETIETDLRVFHLTNLATEKPVIWVEGVGSLAGLHANHYSIDCDKMDEGLVCKMTDDEIIYHYNGFEGFEDCPFDIASSSQKLPEPLELKLYPNPVHNSLRISGDANNIGNSRYRIYNVTGQEIKRGYLDYSSETTIDVSTFRSGAYIIEIYNQEKHLLTNKKFIISN